MDSTAPSSSSSAPPATRAVPRRHGATTSRGSSARSSGHCSTAGSTSPSTAPRTCRVSCPRASRSPASRRVRTPPTSGSGRAGRSPRFPKGRGSEPRASAAARSCSPSVPTSTSSSCEATSIRGCGSAPTARSTGSSSPRPVSSGSAAAAAADLTDREALVELSAERAVVAGLGASCDTPVGVCARHDDGVLLIRGFAGLPDGSEHVYDEVRGDPDQPVGIGEALVERMLGAGAGELLERASAGETDG